MGNRPHKLKCVAFHNMHRNRYLLDCRCLDNDVLRFENHLATLHLFARPSINVQSELLGSRLVKHWIYFIHLVLVPIFNL